MSGSKSGGISVMAVVGIVFITLKMVDKIDWPWVWVLAPFWIPFAIFFSVIGVMILFAIVVALLGAKPRMSITKRK